MGALEKTRTTSATARPVSGNMAYLPISLGILAAGALILQGTAALSRRRKARLSVSSRTGPTVLG